MVRMISKGCTNSKMFGGGRLFSCLAAVLLLLLAWIVNSATPAPAISLSEEPPRRKVIVIDPGHGGNDLGAVGPSGLAEKVVTLSVARKMKEILEATYTVYLTRDEDDTLDIEDRTAVANHHRADVFISLHAGSAFGHQGRGTVIFYFGAGTGPGPMSPKEHRDPLEINEKPAPWDDIQERHTVKAQHIAQLVHRHLLNKISPLDRGICEAPCMVLRGADMPAILIEIAHLSHPAEEADLRKPEVVTAAAEAICAAIREYFEHYP
jgi:N-acetylmuramoyl-L-alanine amidase